MQLSRLLPFLCLALFLPQLTRAQGVSVVDASEGIYLHLLRNEVEVNVENQVAVVTTRQRFYNDSDDSVRVSYAFPLPSEASATGLRWLNRGIWYDARIASEEQDDTLPGSGSSIDPSLTAHLGETPLRFYIDQWISAGDELTVELYYVQLLPYAFGSVDFSYPNGYDTIQANPVEELLFNFALTSQRTIQVIDLASHSPSSVRNDGAHASVASEQFHAIPRNDYHVRYTLDPEELGLFGFSTSLPDSMQVDDLGAGFFTFVAEPDPSNNTEVVNKVFTLIVDRSGSMSGDKIVQARNAASFTVNNLNEGDRFNIVDFSSNISQFRSEHVPFTPSNRDAALQYISQFQASGSTNISGAFGTAIPQFAAADNQTANIIVFFTDGMATTGITDTPGILTHVETLVNQTETTPLIFTFGIGSNVDQPLLSRLAADNSGLAAFLGNDELEARITEFYLRIRNPVLLDTEISFSPGVIHEVYPNPLPNLYKGQQMIVSGRYDEGGPVTITLRGTAFGIPVSYDYTLNLTSDPLANLQFLNKLWAKQKIEHLLVQYYSLGGDQSNAEEIRQEIVELSLGYGVISPFTSFQGGDVSDDQGDGGGDDGGGDGGGGSTNIEDQVELPQIATLLGNYPNPFREQTTIRLEVTDPTVHVVTIRIYNPLGQIVRVLEVPVHGPGIYEVVWDGRTQSGMAAPAGVYLYIADFGDALLAETMMLVR